MNLSPISLINNNTYFKQQKAEKTTQKTYSATNSIASNTLQEAIGRSQVSFCGTGKMTKKGFEYEQKSPFNSSGEDIKYNSETGELEYSEYYPNGDVKKSIRFIPSEKTSVVFEYDEDNNTTKTIKSPKGTLIEVHDELGRQTYFEETNTKKQSKSIKTDYDRKRRVITLSAPEMESKVKVYDLNTGKSVTKGPLVEDIFEIEPGIFETINIVTGEIYKREEHLNKGKTIKITEFSRETGIISRQIEIEKGETTTTDFNEKGLKTKRIITDKKGTSRIIIKYGEDGIHEISKIKNEYTKERKLTRQTMYQPNMDIIQKIVEFNPSNQERTYHYFNSIPNILIYSDTFKEDKLIKRVEYYDNSKNPKRIFYYGNNGSHVEEHYEETGKYPLKQKHYFDTDGTMCKIEIYDTSTGKLEQTREQHPNAKGIYFVKSFDSYSGKLYKKDTVTHNDMLMERVYYHENGLIPKKIIKFNEDRSYSETYYDETFKLIETREFNPDRTPKF